MAAPQAEDRLASLLESARRASFSPGVAAALSVSASRIYACSGYADLKRGWPLVTSSKFGIACITKLLVAVLVHKLAKEGRISLDQPISSLPIEDATTLPRDITVRHLLTHTGGYQGPLIYGVGYRSFNWQNFVTQFPVLYRPFRPGAVFNYENTGHVILGEVLKNITGLEILDQLKKTIFDPLGIVPSILAKDFNNPNSYVAPHEVSAGQARATVPLPFGTFWSASLADIVLSLSDFLSIGEAIIGVRPELKLPSLTAELEERFVVLPQTISGLAREHSPAYFNSLCAEYGSGWCGYAGSALGQTCGIRFNAQKRMVCAVALNAWLPITRDNLFDRICAIKSHPDSGSPGGLNGISHTDIAGEYVGGGNIIRNLRVSLHSCREIEITLGRAGVQIPPISIAIDQYGRLKPEPNALLPGIGFFRENGTQEICMMIGMTALRKTC